VIFLDQVQFFRFLKGRCHGNQFCFIPDLFAWSRSISGSTGLIFTIFAPYGSTELHISIRSSFFRYLKGCCHGNQLKLKIGVFYGPLYIVALPFGKGLQYRNSDFKRLDRMNISTSCTILVTFSPETSEFTLLKMAPFVAIWQKSAYHAKYLRMFWTYLDVLYSFGRRISGDDFPSIRLAVAKGSCYGNQLNRPMEDVRKRHMGPPLLFASAFDNWLIVNLLSKDSMAIIIVSKFGDLLSSNLGVYAVKTHNFSSIFARNLTTIFIRHVGVSKRIGR